MRLSAWLLSSLMLLGIAACGGGSGGGGGGTVEPPASNRAPIAAVLATGQVGAGGTTADLSTSVGADVTLSGASSTDADGDALVFHWTLTGRPSGSQLAPSSSTADLEFTADVLGTYVFVLRVTDSHGAFAEKSVSILANNLAPNPAVLINATYAAEPTVLPPRVITIGATVVLDASSSTDPDGDAVRTTWGLTQKPTGSTAALVIIGQTARFTADLQGTYEVRAHGEDPAGAYVETTYVFNAANRAPAAILVASALPVVANGGQNSLQASVGYDIVLDGATSSDADGDTLTRTWALTSKPLSSTAQLNVTSGNATGFSPDVLGTYVVTLTVTDTSGASATYTTDITVNNRQPIAIATSTSPTALPSAPSIRVPVNTLLTLRGIGSTDADGDVLTYIWSVMSAPSGSTASLATPTAANTEFIPDVDGSYVVRLRVTDSSGAFSQRTLTIDIGNYPPVAVTNKSNVSVVVGSAVSASAALSYDEDGASLSYSWTLDAKPSGSMAVITTPSTAAITLTPDVPGTYVAAVTVSDGMASNVAYVTVRAVPVLTASVQLPFAPQISKYSRGLDKLVVVNSSSNVLAIVDPFTGIIKSVVVPALAVRSLQLSPNGKLAAILYDGRVSLVDLETASLVRTSFTGGAHTDAYLQNDGVAYLVGGDQFVSPPVTILNLASGASLPSPGFLGGGALFYGTQTGVFADSRNEVFQVSQGLSPTDIDGFTVDPVQHAVLSSRGSPYHGDFSIGAELYLSEDQTRLFTSAGTFFNTSTLTYEGTLGTPYISLSQSSQADELLGLTYQVAMSGGLGYGSVYKRFSGPVLLPDADIPLPLISGQQSYGIEIFHSANANHVIVVQIGEASTSATTGVTYYVIAR